jgi:hypothetical protein
LQESSGSSGREQVEHLDQVVLTRNFWSSSFNRNFWIQEVNFNWNIRKCRDHQDSSRSKWKCRIKWSSGKRTVGIWVKWFNQNFRSSG